MSTGIRRRTIASVLVLLVVAACGDDNPVTPAPTPTPTPAPAPTPPRTYTLAGMVTEPVPTANVTIPGATVTIVDGPNAGATSVSDGSGRYSLAGLQFAGFSVSVSAPNYVPITRGISLTTASTTTVNLQLAPVPHVIQETLTGTLSGGEQNTCGLLRKPCRVHRFSIHHSGPFTARLTWNTGADLDLTLLRGAIEIAEANGVRSFEEVSANLLPDAYTLQVIYYSGALITNYNLLVTRMN